MLHISRILIYAKLWLPTYETPENSFIYSHNSWGIVLGEGKKISEKNPYLAPTWLTV